jgi:hypothetical protein
MLRRDPERLNKLRIAIRYLLRQDALERGHQTRLAEHFNVSRQRVHQLVNQEQERQDRVRRLRAARLQVAIPPVPAPPPSALPAEMPSASP